MKIFHITSAYKPYAVGGAEVVVSSLAEEQVKKGHDVHVLHMSPVASDSYVDKGVRVHPIVPPYLLKVTDHASANPIIRRINKIQISFNKSLCEIVEKKIRLYSPDIVHTHSMPDIPTLIWRTARKNGAKVVHTLHDYDLLCARATLYKSGNCNSRHLFCKFHSNVKSRELSEINYAVSISQKVLDVHRSYGLFQNASDPKASVIWNSCPSNRLPKRELGLDGVTRFGFIGRLVPEKGISLLIEACKLLPPDKWTLDIAGRAPVSDEGFRKEAEGLPINFVGWQATTSFLSSIDALVVPSLWDEPFGLTVIEGIAAGIPVIGSDAGAIPEILQTLSTPLIFDSTSPISLAKAMGDVITQGPSSFVNEGEFSSLLERVQVSRMEKSYSDVYDHIIEEG